MKVLLGQAVVPNGLSGHDNSSCLPAAKSAPDLGWTSRCHWKCFIFFPYHFPHMKEHRSHQDGKLFPLKPLTSVNLPTNPDVHGRDFVDSMAVKLCCLLKGWVQSNWLSV